MWMELPCTTHLDTQTLFDAMGLDARADRLRVNSRRMCPIKNAYDVAVVHGAAGQQGKSNDFAAKLIHCAVENATTPACWEWPQVPHGTRLPTSPYYVPPPARAFPHRGVPQRGVTPRPNPHARLSRTQPTSGHLLPRGNMTVNITTTTTPCGAMKHRVAGSSECRSRDPDITTSNMTETSNKSRATSTPPRLRLSAAPGSRSQPQHSRAAAPRVRGNSQASPEPHRQRPLPAPRAGPPVSRGNQLPSQLHPQRHHPHPTSAKLRTANPRLHAPSTHPNNGLL